MFVNQSESSIQQPNIISPIVWYISIVFMEPRFFMFLTVLRSIAILIKQKIPPILSYADWKCNGECLLKFKHKAVSHWLQ